MAASNKVEKKTRHTPGETHDQSQVFARNQHNIGEDTLVWKSRYQTLTTFRSNDYCFRGRHFNLTLTI